MRVVVAIALLPGCFYVDEVVDRPQIFVTSSSTTAARGQCVTVTPHDGDPAPINPTYDWQVQVCGVTPTSNGEVHCNDTLVFESHQKTAVFTVPLTNTDVPDAQTTLAGCIELPALPLSHGTPLGVTQRLQIRLDARDDHGVLISNGTDITVIGASPEVDLRTSARSYTVGVPIDVFAVIHDLDTPPDQVSTAWTVSPDLSGRGALEDIPVVQTRADQREAHARVTIMEPGTWTVNLTATDTGDLAPAQSGAADAPSGGPPKTIQPIAIAVAADRPPFLAQWQPIVPPVGDRLPITEPTLFQIPLVDDDLEPYPGIIDAAPFGAAQFAWSILPPGATERQTLAGATGNRVEFDPAGFAPGDAIELRVEIRDSAHPWPACADAEPTCSADGSDRLQRQTWRLEVQ